MNLPAPARGPMLRSERLELWRPQAGDVAGLVALMAPEETRRYLGAVPPGAAGQFARLLRNAGSWSLYGYGNFILRHPGSDAIVGTCGVFHSWRGFGQGLDDAPEAGWIIAHDQAGKGYAREAMRTILAWFDDTHGKRRIAAMIEEGNRASARVAVSLGFTRYGRHLFEGSWLDLYERLPR